MAATLEQNSMYGAPTPVVNGFHGSGRTLDDAIPGTCDLRPHQEHNGEVIGTLDGSSEREHETPRGAAGPQLSVNGVQASEASLSQCEDVNSNKSSPAIPGIFEPIAIVGMAMRLPGGAHDASSFWDLLINKRSGHCRVPESRFNIDAFYGPGKPGQLTMQSGYFLEDLNLAHMDTSFWSMKRQEIEAMDPQQRLLLEVVYECFENAGAKNYRGSDVGCYVGNFGRDWGAMDDRENQGANVYRAVGHDDFMLANRVSYEFDLRGPRYACASELALAELNLSKQYDHSDGLFRFALGFARCLPSHSGRRLCFCSRWRRQSYPRPNNVLNNGQRERVVAVRNVQVL